MRPWRWAAALLAGLCLATWWLSRPQPLTSLDLPDHEPDSLNGERMFHAGGCASCHGQDAEGETDAPLLGGGLELLTPAGVFRAPNISPHPEAGIGSWSELDFINAMQGGVSPDDRHYYPSFPYTSYIRMEREDLLDLKAYLDGLPAVDNTVAGHELAFPYNMRWTLGLWKRLFLDAEPRVAIDESDPLLARGRYLVEGAGHCGECHTPRNRALALLPGWWLSGATLPEGEGKAPNITPHADGLQDWSESDIVFYLETGVGADFDVVGGPMVDVQENMARLSAEDRAAIAAYLKAIPPQP